MNERSAPRLAFSPASSRVFLPARWRAFSFLGAIVLVRLVLQVAAMNRYGYFRDELYYLASTDHLDWGYVDHPPLSIAILSLIRTAFGESLTALRAVPALVGAATVYLTAFVCRQFGGGRFAQGLAALSVCLSPVFLGTAHYYSMNVFDQLYWTLAVMVLLRALDTERRIAWCVLGVVLGASVLNKISALWLGAGMVVGVGLTPYRRVIREPGPYIAVLVAGVCALPYLLWQASHGWPTLEFMRNAAIVKMADVSPLGFFLDQILTMNPGTALVWLPALVLGLAGSEGARGRVVASIFLTVFMLLVLAGRSRASYLAPAYPPVLALGAVALERMSTSMPRRWLRPSLAVAVIALGLVALPMALPILPVETFVRYQAALGLSPRTEERQQMGALPQQYADMFGWDEMTSLVAEAYHRLTPAEQQRCRVFGQNYGEAGAIDVLGRSRGLPSALSGHNSYWLWGPDAESWDVLIIIGGDREANALYFEDIEIVGQTSSRWSMPYERGLDVSIARRPRMDFRMIWPALKKYV
jgi:Dolichyl-phosphate-mannose-protein mannosyltransferase